VCLPDAKMKSSVFEGLVTKEDLRASVQHAFDAGFNVLRGLSLCCLFCLLKFPKFGAAGFISIKIFMMLAMSWASLFIMT
jgi:hypothetical protein